MLSQILRPKNSRSVAGAVVSLVLALLLAACGGQQGPSGGLNVSGSTSVAPFAEHLAELYQRQHPGSAVNVQSLGSTAGIQAAINRVAEIGMSSRDLAPDEAAQLDQLVIARDALAVIVHPSNPIGPTWRGRSTHHNCRTRSRVRHLWRL
jgi:ABC-type phosphate transport system substrate-binding protein